MNPLSGRRRSKRRRFSGSPNKVVVYLKAAARSDGYACPAPSHRLIEVPVRTHEFHNEHDLCPLGLDLHSRYFMQDKKKRSPQCTMERSITFNLSSARETPRRSFQFCRLGPLGSSGPSRRRIPAFPRNLPPEECRIAPTLNGTARMGEIPCMLCLSSRTDGQRVAGVATSGSVGSGATNYGQ